jgi:hypothetical protein
MEFPGTHRGHVLVADFGGEPWTAWELPDGRWALSYGTMSIHQPQVVLPSWTEARQLAERLRTQGPRVANPIAPLVAAAAGAGVAAAVRHATGNPAPTHFARACEAATRVAARLPGNWLVEPVRCRQDGSVIAVVRPGHLGIAQQRLRGLSFPVHVIERTPRPRV